MIQEYAIDPELIASEFPGNSLFFKDAFGPNSIKFLSCFPSRWKGELIGALKRSKFNDDVQAKKAVMAFAERLLERAIVRKQAPLAVGGWLDKAEHEHGQNPFHAILTKENTNGNQAVIPLEDAYVHEKWNAPTVCHAERTASALSSVVEPLLMRAREIIFVDPYFDSVRDDYKDVFKEYFKCIGKSLLRNKPKVNIITSSKALVLNKNTELTRDIVEDFKADCYENLPEIMPEEFSVTIAILKEFEKGQGLHNRFILTRNVGILFGEGLNCLRSKKISYDNLSVFSYKKGEEGPWELYNLQRQPPAFKIVIEPFIVQHG